MSTYNADRSAVATVHMDALAATGMTFTNAHTSSAICSPTRYGLMLGRHPVRVGKIGFQTKYDDVWLPDPNDRNVADLFREAGYATGYVGKWHLGYTVYSANGEIHRGNAQDAAVPEPDWTRGINNHPGDRGFDYAFGHTSSADIPPYKYFLNNDWLDTSSFWVTKKDALASGIADTPADGTGVSTIRDGWADMDWDFNQIQRRLRDKAVEYIRDNARTKSVSSCLFRCRHRTLPPRPIPISTAQRRITTPTSSKKQTRSSAVSWLSSKLRAFTATP